MKHDVGDKVARVGIETIELEGKLIAIDSIALVYLDKTGIGRDKVYVYLNIHETDEYHGTNAVIFWFLYEDPHIRAFYEWWVSRCSMRFNAPAEPEATS